MTSVEDIAENRQMLLQRQSDNRIVSVPSLNVYLRNIFHVQDALHFAASKLADSVFLPAIHVIVFTFPASTDHRFPLRFSLNLYVY